MKQFVYIKNYPYIECCPGCMENCLQELSEQPGNQMFLTEQPVSLARMIDALARQCHGGDLLLAVWEIRDETIEAIIRMQEEGRIGAVKLVYDKVPPVNSHAANIQFRQSANFTGLISLQNARRTLTVTGLPQQGKILYPATELYHIINDPEQQQTLRKVYLRLFG